MANLKISPIKIVGYVDDPLVKECFDLYPNNCNAPGYEAEYIYTLLSFLKLTMEWIRVGDYDTMLTFLDNGTADITAVSMMVHARYGEKYGYSQPYLNDALAFYVKETRANIKETLLLLDQFSWDLWFALLLVTLAIVCIKYASHQIHNGDKKLLTKHVKLMFQVCNALRAGVLYYLWMVFLAVILNFYGNLIPVDLLTSEKISILPIRSMMDLGQKLLKKECQLALYRAYLADEEFHGTIINPTVHNKSWAPLFRQAYHTNPPIYTESREELIQFVANSSCIIGLDWMSLETFYRCRQCNIKMIVFNEEPEMRYDYTFYHTRKDICDSVNTIMVSDSLRALPEILAKKYYNNQLSANCPEGFYSNSIVALGTNKLQAGFYGLFIGVFIPIGIFVCYAIKNYLKQNMSKIFPRKKRKNYDDY